MAGRTTRRAHKKSRAGCITCKARRVKCTEERPTCTRCSRAGRPCEGYEADRLQAQTNSESDALSLSMSMSPSGSLSPYFGGAMSPLELRSLQYFHDRTVPALAGFFESNLWQRLLLQISVTEPGLRHAMIAVGFFQKLSELHGLPSLDFDEQQPGRLDRHDAFALSQYMKAVTLIRSRLGTQRPDNIVTLVACILFVCLEFLRGDRKAAFAHLKSGLDIIKTSIEYERSTQAPTSAISAHTQELNESDLAPMFARMSLLTTLNRQPKSDPFEGLLDLNMNPSPESEPFESLEQARMVSINLMNAVLRFCSLVINRQLPGEETIAAGRAEMEGRLERWSQAFEAFLPTTAFKKFWMITYEQRGAAVLRIHHIMALIWTRVVRCPQNEWSYDFMLEDFTAIIDASEAIINLTTESRRDTDDTPSMFSLDHGLIPPLFFAAIKCRDPPTRRRAILLLYRAPRREGVWDAVMAAKVAEVHVSVEEEPVAQPSREHWPPLHSRIIDFDMRLRDPRKPNQQLVILRMVRPDGQEEATRREQHLYYQDVGMRSIPYSDRAMKNVLCKDPISIFGDADEAPRDVEET